MILADAVAADLPAIVSLMNDAFRGTGAGASWNTEAGFIQGDRTSVTLLTGEIAAKPDACLLVGRWERDGAIIASVWLEPAGNDIWYLGSLTIAPLLQNVGAGRWLLAAAERQAQEKGATAIRMKVVNLRDTLIAWYIRRGYHLTGEAEPFPYGDTRFGVPKRDDLSFLIMTKRL